jgi:predicted small secreted protein
MKQILILTGLFLHLTASHAQNTPANRYAGIEIGSTGVKFMVMDIKKEVDKTDNLGYFVYDRVEEASENTNFIDFTEGTSRMTVRAVDQFYNKAKNHYNIVDKNIYVYISSGVVSQCLREENITDQYISTRLHTLRKRILEQLPYYARAKNGCIGIATDAEEAELTHIGLVPRELQADVALIDIGGGHIQGGYFRFEPMKRFVPFHISEGTRSLSNRAKKDMLPTDFDKMYIRRVQDTLNAQLSNEIRNCASDVRTKSDIILTGGICWAVARITHPEDNKDMQRITLDNVNQVLTRVSTPQAFKKLVEESKKAENKALKAVLDVFNQDLLISGSLLLKKVLEEINRNSTDYRFYVYKASYTASLKAYIIASISAADTGYRSICKD